MTIGIRLLVVTAIVSYLITIAVLTGPERSRVTKVVGLVLALLVFPVGIWAVNKKLTVEDLTKSQKNGEKSSASDKNDEK